MRYMVGFVLALASVFVGCGETSGTGGSAGEGGASLPWPSPFIEPGYTESQVLEQATAVRNKFSEQIPASTRDEVTSQVAMALTSRPSASKLDQITIDPQTESEAWVMAGVSAIFQGSLRIASWSFANAVLADPTDERSLNQLGWALLADDRVTEAKGVLLHALEVGPQLWSLWSNLGHAYDVSEQPTRATYYFGQGLERNPESLNMHLRRGGLMLQGGDVVAAAAHATQALAIAPTNSEAQEFADAVEAAGGAEASPVPVPPPPPGGMGEVLRDYDDCVADAAQRYAQAMIPYLEDIYDEDLQHQFRIADIQEAHVHCLADCGPSESCSSACDATFCASATPAEVHNYLRHLQVSSVDMSFNAAFRTRWRGCAYNAVETHEDSLSEEQIQEFIAYVNGWIKIEAEASYRGFLDEQADLARRLPVMTGCLDAGSIPPESLTVSFDLDSLGLSMDLEACLDGFACLSFGDTTFGFSAGINVVSGGIELDYGNPDVIFALGAGVDAAAGAAGVELKLSIRNGIGISPNASFGGLIRSKHYRDFWLLSF